MKSVFAIAAVAMLALAPAANAADAKLNDCITMAKQVATALETATPGTATDQAKTEADAGRSYCASRMYKQGVARYSAALQLLGK